MHTQLFRTLEEAHYKLCDLWPGAVAAEEVLDEVVKVQAVGIARDINSILTGDLRTISMMHEVCSHLKSAMVSAL